MKPIKLILILFLSIHCLLAKDKPADDEVIDINELHKKIESKKTGVEFLEVTTQKKDNNYVMRFYLKNHDNQAIIYNAEVGKSLEGNPRLVFTGEAVLYCDGEKYSIPKNIYRGYGLEIILRKKRQTGFDIEIPNQMFEAHRKKHNEIKQFSVAIACGLLRDEKSKKWVTSAPVDYAEMIKFSGD